jgi:tetratricopeptide (TPR) repeat protein
VDRVTTSILAYIAVILGAIVLTFWILPLPPRWPHAIVVIALLVPGRVQGVLWRDFFRGRHAMDENRILEAARHFSQFEAALAQHPRLRYAIFLQWSFYTWNAGAMVRNNLAACDMALGRLASAEAGFEQAIALDRGYPVPYFNLAVIAQAKNQPERAAQLLSDAKARGFRGGTRERVIAMAGGILAAIEGRS